MTDILDLDGWAVLNRHQEDGVDVLEAEYAPEMIRTSTTNRRRTTDHRRLFDDIFTKGTLMPFHETTPAAIKREQKRFIRELSDNIVKELREKITKGEVPQDWDGIELREWLAMRFAAASFSMLEKHNRRRYREFKSTILERNL